MVLGGDSCHLLRTLSLGDVFSVPASGTCSPSCDLVQGVRVSKQDPELAVNQFREVQCRSGASREGLAVGVRAGYVDL